jgi:hypothetical protein
MCLDKIKARLYSVIVEANTQVKYLSEQTFLEGKNVLAVFRGEPKIGFTVHAGVYELEFFNDRSEKIVEAIHSNDLPLLKDTNDAGLIATKVGKINTSRSFVRFNAPVAGQYIRFYVLVEE